MHKIKKKQKKGFFKAAKHQNNHHGAVVRHCGFAAICRSAAALYAGIY